MNDDSDIQSIQDSRRLSSSFSNNGGLMDGFFVGSPKDSFNVTRWIDDSKKLFTNIIKNKPQETQQIEDFNNLFTPTRRNRTQSVSSDISIEEQPIGERRSSFSERFFAMQMQQKTANDKFNNFRTAVTSYYD